MIPAGYVLSESSMLIDIVSLFEVNLAEIIEFLLCKFFENILINGKCITWLSNILLVLFVSAIYLARRFFAGWIVQHTVALNIKFIGWQMQRYIAVIYQAAISCSNYDIKATYNSEAFAQQQISAVVLLSDLSDDVICMIVIYLTNQNTKIILLQVMESQFNQRFNDLSDKTDIVLREQNTTLQVNPQQVKVSNELSSCIPQEKVQKPNHSDSLQNNMQVAPNVSVINSSYEQSPKVIPASTSTIIQQNVNQQQTPSHIEPNPQSNIADNTEHTAAKMEKVLAPSLMKKHSIYVISVLPPTFHESPSLSQDNKSEQKFEAGKMQNQNQEPIIEKPIQQALKTEADEPMKEVEDKANTSNPAQVKALELPVKDDRSDHTIERLSNKAESSSSSSEQNQTTVDYYNVEIVDRGYDTQEDSDIQQVRDAQVQNELQALQTNRFLSHKLEKNTAKAHLPKKQVDYLISGKKYLHHKPTCIKSEKKFNPKDPPKEQQQSKRKKSIHIFGKKQEEGHDHHHHHRHRHHHPRADLKEWLEKKPQPKSQEKKQAEKEAPQKDIEQKQQIEQTRNCIVNAQRAASPTEPFTGSAPPSKQCRETELIQQTTQLQKKIQQIKLPENKQQTSHKLSSSMAAPKKSSISISRYINNPESSNEPTKKTGSIRRQFISSTSKTRLYLQHMPSYRLEDYLVSTSTPKFIENPSRTQSLMQICERNASAIEYPSVAQIHADSESPPNVILNSPRLFLHTEKRKPADSAGKILHRKSSDKKAFEFYVTPPKTDQFRIRPMMPKLRAKQERLSMDQTQSSSNGFSIPLKKMSKEQFIQKIDINEQSLKKFVRNRPNIPALEDKNLRYSAIIPSKQDIQQQSSEVLVRSALQRPKFNSSQILSPLTKTPGKLRYPVAKQINIVSSQDILSGTPRQIVKSNEQFCQVPKKPARKQKWFAVEEDLSFQNFSFDLSDQNALPMLPSIPLSNMSSEQLIQLARETFAAFGVNVSDTSLLNIKKYRNCVYFGTVDKHILWHYSGKFYIGDWNMNCKSPQGEKSGKGIEYFPNKYIYEGEFCYGKRHGQGTMKINKEEVYTGQWQKGMKHGYGKLTEVNGTVYEGEWKEGKKSGYGKLITIQQDTYQGMFQNSWKEGYGKQNFKNGDKYEGNYHYNKLFGKGTYIWKDGSYYIGDFQNNMRHGRGVWRSNEINGEMYEGDYQNDKKCGFGKYTWETGVTYTGQFEDDMRHGQGTFRDEKGSIQRGFWEKGNLKSKLYNEQKDKLRQQPLRNSMDLRRANSTKADSEVPLQKKRLLYSSSMSQITDTTQLPYIISSLRQYPSARINQPN